MYKSTKSIKVLAIIFIFYFECHSSMAEYNRALDRVQSVISKESPHEKRKLDEYIREFAGKVSAEDIKRLKCIEKILAAKNLSPAITGTILAEQLAIFKKMSSKCSAPVKEIYAALIAKAKLEKLQEEELKKAKEKEELDAKIKKEREQEKEKRKKLNKGLRQAIMAGDIVKAKKLFAEGANKNAQGQHNNTPLHEAVNIENQEIVQWLLSIDVDIQLKNSENMTALEIARAKGNKVIIEMVEEISFDLPEIVPNTDLKEAEQDQKKRESEVKEKETKENEPVQVEVPNIPQSTPAPISEREDERKRDEQDPADVAGLLNEDELLQDLHNLIQAQSIDLNSIKKLLNAAGGIDINKKANGKTALHIAAQIGNLDLVKLLLENGGGCNTHDDFYGWTPLHWAASNGQKAVHQYEQAKKELNLDEYTAMLKTMMSDESTRDILTEDGLTVFDIALIHGNTGTIELLENVYDVNTKSKNKSTALHYAALNDNPEVIQFLVVKGAKIDARDNRNETPLHWASRQGNLYAIHKLIELGADKTVKNIDAETPPNLYHKLHPDNNA